MKKKSTKELADSPKWDGEVGGASNSCYTYTDGAVDRMLNLTIQKARTENAMELREALNLIESLKKELAAKEPFLKFEVIHMIDKVVTSVIECHYYRLDKDGTSARFLLNDGRCSAHINDVKSIKTIP